MGKIEVIAIRVITLISDVIAFSLVTAGARACYSFGCPLSLDISFWKQLPKIGGQYFVFVATLLLITATAAVLILAIRNVPKQPLTLTIFDAVAALFCLLFAGLEIYYGCIWDPEIDVYVATGIDLYYKRGSHHYYKHNQSWIAAVAFYLFSTITYTVTAILTRQ